MAKGIQSILLGFRLLQAIAECDEPTTLKSVSAAAGMSASKARMYLISLIETGLVAQSAESGLYSLGPYSRRLGTRAHQRTDARAAMLVAVRKLQKSSRALVLLCEWQESGIVIVAAEDGGEPQPVQWRIGGSASLAGTATGAVFLSYGPKELVSRRLKSELTGANLSERELKRRVRELERRAADTRKRGIAEADSVVFAAGVTISGYAAIAAPVFGPDKQLNAVLTLIYRIDRPHKSKAELVQQILLASTECSTS